PIYKIKYVPCPCVACRGKLKTLLKEKYSTEKILLLCLHNLISARSYFNKIIQYLTYEDFRAFLEKSSFDNINIISTLKTLDKEYFNLIRYETPIFQENQIIKSLGPSSYNRPDFREFRERTINNFEPELYTRLIILFPCSAKKPYSESKSHQKFQAILRKFPEFPDFQEIILTSPLGAIPRQLENIYPVNSYDISVTGDWDDQELNISANMLIKLLEKYDFKIPVICHLEKSYLEILKRAKINSRHNFYFTKIYEKVTSKESLESLKNLIEAHINDYSPKLIEKSERYLTNSWIRKFIKIIDYQFGNGIAEKIFCKEIKYKKNRGRTKMEIIDKETNQTLGTFQNSTGQILLTIKGANLLAPFKNLCSNFIVFNNEIIKGTTLFRPGILDFSLDLVPSNNVIILDEKKTNLIGVGRLIVGSNYIKNSKHGKVVEIYERV
ncbi:MAG: DUF5591 domain-containing protein, partial [Candidatus Hermodarchaeota archaeon]